MGLGFRIICSMRKKNNAIQAAARMRIGLEPAILFGLGRPLSNPFGRAYKYLSPFSMNYLQHKILDAGDVAISFFNNFLQSPRSVVVPFNGMSQ